VIFGAWEWLLSVLSIPSRNGYRKQVAQAGKSQSGVRQSGRAASNDRIFNAFLLTHVDSDSALPGNLTKGATMHDDTASGKMLLRLNDDFIAALSP